MVDIQPCPPIPPGPGQIVLTTINHLHNDVVELIVRDQRGRQEAIRPTGFHKFYSETRGSWVSAEDLQNDEVLASRHGPITVVSRSRVPGIHRVYNMTVEGEHVYSVSGLELVVHNNGCKQPDPKDADDFLKHGTKSDQTVTTKGLDLDEIKAREGHDPTGFSLTPHDDIADGFANNPLRPGQPTVIGIRPSRLKKRGINLSSETGLTDAGELKILPEDFGKIKAGDFEVLR